MKQKNTEHEIQRFCAFCEYATQLLRDDDMLCSRRGVVSARHSCRKFLYDPLKRVPKRKISLSEDTLLPKTD